MITNATISVIGVLIILVTAWGYYAVPARKLAGRGLYLLLLAFALVHLIGDGVLRTEIGEPMNLELQKLNGVGVFYFLVYLTGVVGVLQVAFDIVWVKTREKVNIAGCLVMQVPAIVLVITSIAVRGSFAMTVLKYMPLLYTLVLFFVTIWFYEKLDRGVRIGTLAAMIGCVLIFIANAVLHITQIPLLVPVLLVALALSWDGRGELVLGDISDEEFERLQENGYFSVEITEEEESEEPATHTVVVTDRAQDTATLPELEKMMREKEKSARGKLSLDEELDASEAATTEEAESVASVEPSPVTEEVVADVQPETPVPSVAAVTTEQPGAAGMTAVQPAVQTDTVSIREEDILAAGMRAVEPTPMEQLTAATALTAESDSQREDAMQQLSQVDETVLDVLHNRPLILEKDLNGYYHRMKEAMKEKDHDSCLEILSEMSEYRISGIHVTRYERIRHAVMDEDWKTVEKELKDF